MSAEHILNPNPFVLPPGMLERILASVRKLGRQLIESSGEASAVERLASLERDLQNHVVMTVDFAWYAHFAWTASMASDEDRTLARSLAPLLLQAGGKQMAVQLDDAEKATWIGYDTPIMEARILLGKIDSLGQTFGDYLISEEGLLILESIANHYQRVTSVILSHLPPSASLQAISRVQRMPSVMLNLVEIARAVNGKS